MVATCNKNFTKHSRKEKHNITVQHAVKFWSRRFMKLESTHIQTRYLCQPLRLLSKYEDQSYNVIVVCLDVSIQRQRHNVPTSRFLTVPASHGPPQLLIDNDLALW